VANVGGGRAFRDVELLGDALVGVPKLGGGFGDQTLPAQAGSDGLAPVPAEPMPLSSPSPVSEMSTVVRARCQRLGLSAETVADPAYRGPVWVSATGNSRTLFIEKRRGS
jgi:hypothetical protein